MLSKHNQVNRDQIEMIALDQLVPADHLVRKMEAALVRKIRSARMQVGCL